MPPPTATNNCDNNDATKGKHHSPTNAQTHNYAPKPGMELGLARKPNPVELVNGILRASRISNILGMCLYAITNLASRHSRLISIPENHLYFNYILKVSLTFKKGILISLLRGLNVQISINIFLSDLYSTWISTSGFCNCVKGSIYM